MKKIEDSPLKTQADGQPSDRCSWVERNEDIYHSRGQILSILAPNTKNSYFDPDSTLLNHLNPKNSLALPQQTFFISF